LFAVIGIALAGANAVVGMEPSLVRPPSLLKAMGFPACPAYTPADRKLDAISVAQQLSALRFFFLKTLKRPWMVEDMPIRNGLFAYP